MNFRKLKIGERIIYLSQCSSTNDLAKESVQMGEPHGTIYRCNAQTSGRGKEGKTWFSIPGKGLYFSIILKPEESLSICWLPYISGISVCESVKELFGVNALIKWPNDVYIEDKKFCGILIESSIGSKGIEYAIVGIGINVNHDIEDFPESLKEKATSLKIVLGKEVDKELLFEKIIEKFNLWYKRLTRDQITHIHKTISSLSYIPLGSKIEILEGEKKVKGEFEGFDLEGALLLKDGKKIKKIYSGELIFIENSR